MHLTKEHLKKLHREQTVFVQPINRKETCKDYLHDFLAWMYLQNEDFVQTIREDELLNYFFQEFYHPIWFRAFLKKDKFNRSVMISSYLLQHQHGASIFQQRMRIRPKKNANYSRQEVPQETFLSLQSPEIKEIERLCKENRIKIDPWELQSITAQEANTDLFFLHDLQNERRIG